MRLNPSFSGWPALGFNYEDFLKNPYGVLIPLLVDDPLWAEAYGWRAFVTDGLNPSFSGWPALGLAEKKNALKTLKVLIPLLVDDPLWA